MSVEPSIILAGTDPDLPNQLPQGLKRYSGMREMARGGSAILNSAFDQVIGRTVAIKTLLPGTRNNRSERRRFLREARVTAQLQHPNTVPVYEIGNDLLHGIYFVMKRISGENFFQVLRRIAQNDESTCQAFPVSRRFDIIADCCQALAYAHARGVIHRDVKPENIWVGNFGEVILLDWGTSKVWGHADDNEPITHSTLATKPTADVKQLKTLTGGGQRPGTPLYMSPEQVSGNRGIDERTDVFSVGIVLYEMLTLKEPFRGRNINETFDNIKNQDVPPPSEMATHLNIPPSADDIVMRAIQKRPADRYQSMRKLIADLRNVAGNAIQH